ncbi:MAG: PSD1 and planctomycete cytochrome C domain-containing protein [Fuerstiella sp.]
MLMMMDYWIRLLKRSKAVPRLSATLVRLLAVVSLTSVPTIADEPIVDFARDIRPILNARCTECHGGVKAAGGVSFVYQDRVINAEGDSGSFVVKPGDLDASELFYRITSEDDDRMPPPDGHAPLTKAEIDLIQRWIQQGAPWRVHWAFEPPQLPTVPQTEWEDLARTNIDRFLFQRLQREGLSPAAVEEPGRLLRRLHIGLTGLPPTLAEYQQFEAAFKSDPDAAVERVVDQLLADPAFGERWATMWLDLVRYADSGGLGIDQRRTIWPYRDWVVKAFNEDLPFDQFTVKQLAGDLLPDRTTEDLVATACHRNTQTNNEGGTDDEQFRMEAVIDRVNTTWQTWGSLTFGCVQCHDHPYDPLRHDEYYRFVSLLNDTADSDLSDDAPRWKVPGTPQDQKEADRLRKQILKLKEQIWQAGIEVGEATDWQPVTTLDVRSNNGTTYEVVADSDRGEFQTVGTVETGTHTRLQLSADNFQDGAVTALKLTVLPFNPQLAKHSPEWGFLLAKTEAWTVTAADGGEEQKQPLKFRWSVPDVAWMPTDPMGTINADGSGWGADSRIHYARELVLIPEMPISPQTRIDIHLHCNKNGHGSHPMAIERGFVSYSTGDQWTSFAEPGSAIHDQQQQVTEALQKLRKIEGPSVPVMLSRPDHLSRPTHVFIRGNMLEKGDRVQPGLPAIFDLSMVAGQHPDRLQMAEWWVSERHPLTARVFVNRLWEQLFGIGIVPTLEDFGSSGSRPTHPELLDYLAVRFQRDYEWSVKAILKEIVLSHVYRQSAASSAALQELDPQNRLLARGPRQRMSAEMVRDVSLAVSGLLSRKMGGPPVHPPLPDGVWKPFDAKDKWSTVEPGREDRYRRSLYTYIKRSIPYPIFATFDAPSREFCSPRRLTSNTPLQALATLNDPTFVEFATAFGKRLQKEQTGSLEERLAAGYRLACGMSPGADRLLTLLELHDRLRQTEVLTVREGNDGSTADAEATSVDDSGGNKVVVTDDQQMVWTVLAQVLLNLDESLTW